MVKLQIPDECPKLVALDLSYLRLRNLHLGNTPNLEKLRVHHCTYMVKLQIPAECPKLVNLDLNNNAKLRTLDLGLTPHVERLNLENCCDLEEIDAPVGCMKKVVYLNLNGSGRFKSFEFDKESDSPEVVSLSELHLNAVNRPEFQFSCYYKEDPASSFGNLERLILLGRKDACINLDSFSDIICGLQGLRKLTIERDIPGAPKNLDKLKFLEELRFADIKTLPDNVFTLKHLKSLKIDVSRSWHLKKLPGDIGRLKCLEELSLECREIKTLPGSICKLKHLKSLKIACCDSLEKLPEGIGRLQCLLCLVLEKCKLLQGIPNSICMIKSLRYLSLAHCSSVEELPDEIGLLKCLEELDITGGSDDREDQHKSTSLNKRMMFSSQAIINSMFNVRLNGLLLAQSIIPSTSRSQLKRGAGHVEAASISFFCCNRFDCGFSGMWSEVDGGGRRKNKSPKVQETKKTKIKESPKVQTRSPKNMTEKLKRGAGHVEAASISFFCCNRFDCGFSGMWSEVDGGGRRKNKSMIDFDLLSA
ncbi:leucine-rich repeat domain, L domain-like protein [Artemisia annua]|uniref:Leucine-rich repeat domain, L domain-like protein n=1 Tax=Artemisia annua TaxID=35608 RepID=A0A2U1K9G8_ARTAN|nr:leucine-rich repeat domain, L domain-like protein [Artemisia annua]